MAEPHQFSDPWTVTELNTARLAALPPTLFFHARKKLAEGMVARRFALMAALADHAAGQGIGVEVLYHSRASRALIAANPRHLHILMEDQPLFAANVFHAVPGYLRGYWYFDEVASRNNSSHRLRAFDPGQLSAAYARRFAQKLRTRFIGRNMSKFAQSDRGSEAITKGCIAFFAQDFSTPKHYPNHMTGLEMARAAIAARGDRPVYLKAHPNQPDAEIAQLGALADPANGVQLTTASIHDLLAAADLCITLTSAVGFEAFLHHTPVILGGQTDFHHCAITLTDVHKMPAAMHAALSRVWPFDAYLTWFLRQNCVQDAAKSLPRILSAIHAKGFAWADAEARGHY